MKQNRQVIPIAGLLATMAFAAYTVAQLTAQTQAPTANFTNAATAEVRDAQGQVVLRGQFQLAEEEDDDVERKAKLAPAGSDADASGEAEVEFAKASPSTQEVEFSVRNVAPGVAFTFVIDGVDVATATSDSRGRAEVELEVKMSGSPAPGR
jgi:hypothetical protein